MGNVGGRVRKIRDLRLLIILCRDGILSFVRQRFQHDYSMH
jgi:hypothetical protein